MSIENNALLTFIRFCVVRENVRRCKTRKNLLEAPQVGSQTLSNGFISSSSNLMIKCRKKAWKQQSTSCKHGLRITNAMGILLIRHGIRCCTDCKVSQMIKPKWMKLQTSAQDNGFRLKRICGNSTKKNASAPPPPRQILFY